MLGGSLCRNPWGGPEALALASRASSLYPPPLPAMVARLPCGSSRMWIFQPQVEQAQVTSGAAGATHPCPAPKKTDDGLCLKLAIQQTLPPCLLSQSSLPTQESLVPAASPLCCSLFPLSPRSRASIFPPSWLGTWLLCFRSVRRSCVNHLTLSCSLSLPGLIRTSQPP